MTIDNIKLLSTVVTFRSNNSTVRSPLDTIVETPEQSGDEVNYGVKQRLVRNGFAYYKWTPQNRESVPDWLKDNEYILTGYRPPMPCIKSCLLSAFQLHTETGNIWTHYIGALIFVLLAIYVFIFSEYSTIQLSEKLVFGIFFSGVIICLTVSATYHTVLCHSQPVYIMFLRFDLIGIAILITCYYISYLYYGFDRLPTAKTAYLIITTILGILIFSILFVEKLSHPDYRTLRSILFTIFSSFSIVPIVHFLAIYGYLFPTSISLQLACFSLLVTVSMHILGAFFYCSQIPEKYFPGKCDRWFQSHQLLHILVVLGAIVHFIGVTSLADFIKHLPKDSCN